MRPRRYVRSQSSPLVCAARMLALLAAVALATGCGNAIGDSCGSNADCGTGRTCDRSQPGGYCTVTSCDVRGCPDDAVCVRFEGDQFFCMDVCEDSCECRPSYACVETGTPLPFCNATLPDGETPVEPDCSIPDFTTSPKEI